jgi:beta-glucosidase-like glycosyl hydrolase
VCTKKDILFSTGTLVWNEMAIPMHTGQQRSKAALNAYLDIIIETSSEPELIKEELYEAKKIRDSDYKKADLDQVVQNIPHLTESRKSQVRTLLYNYESLFEGKLGLWDSTGIAQTGRRF